MPIKDLQPDSRPREKLLARGASALSDTELLAILLRIGIQVSRKESKNLLPWMSLVGWMRSFVLNFRKPSVSRKRALERGSEPDIPHRR